MEARIGFWNFKEYLIWLLGLEQEIRYNAVEQATIKWNFLQGGEISIAQAEAIIDDQRYVCLYQKNQKGQLVLGIYCSFGEFNVLRRIYFEKDGILELLYDGGEMINYIFYKENLPPPRCPFRQSD